MNERKLVFQGIEEILQRDREMKEELGEIYDIAISFFNRGKNNDIWEPLLKLYQQSLDLKGRKKELLTAERSIVIAGVFRLKQFREVEQ